MVDAEAIFQRKVKRIAAPLSKSNEFSLVAYNILCDAVFHNGSAKYSHITDEMLKCRGPEPSIAPRHIQLIKELSWLDSDIICLQEVDAFYFPCLVKELGSLGYHGVYKAHNSETHGLATFYKTAKFDMKSSDVCGFTELLGELNDAELKESNKHNQRYAQYTTLTDSQTGQEVVIVNVHLIFNYFREPDNHALQIALFFQQLHKTLPQSAKNATPWVVCGDFNMHSNFPVYEMLRNGKLSVESLEKLNPAKWKYPELRKQNEIINHDSVVLRKHKKSLMHPLKGAKSAYTSVLGNEPVFTHYECCETFEKVFGSQFLIDTLDYMWYSSDSLHVNGVLEMVGEDLITPHHACPNHVFPSDHLSLKAYFQFPE